MALTDPDTAAREAAAAVAVVQRAPDGGRNRPGPGTDLHDPAVGVVSHHDPAGIAGQTLGRSRGNARTVFKDRLAGLLGVREHLGVDVDDDLVALAGGAGIEPVVQRRLRE